MAIEYRIILDDEHEFSYRIEPDRVFDHETAKLAPRWTRLDHQQCNNCPLKRDQHSHCPAAVDLHQVIEDFQGLPAIRKAHVRVRTPEREYNKLVGLEEGLRPTTRDHNHLDPAPPGRPREGGATGFQKAFSY